MNKNIALFYLFAVLLSLCRSTIFSLFSLHLIVFFRHLFVIVAFFLLLCSLAFFCHYSCLFFCHRIAPCRCSHCFILAVFANFLSSLSLLLIFITVFSLNFFIAVPTAYFLLLLFTLVVTLYIHYPHCLRSLCYF